jgi:hypothetical protein
VLAIFVRSSTGLAKAEAAIAATSSPGPLAQLDEAGMGGDEVHLVGVELVGVVEHAVEGAKQLEVDHPEDEDPGADALEEAVGIDAQVRATVAAARSAALAT